MRCLLPLAVYCISLLTLQQLLAAPVAELRDSSDLLQTQSGPAHMEAPVPEVRSEAPDPEPSPAAAVRRPSDALAESLQRVASANARVAAAAAAAGLAWARPASPGLRVLRSLRTRRSVHHRSHHHRPHHVKTNKDGCTLGTCSVHNLSHRLYQLIGQSGREGSSPVNPRSPHSFG